MNCKFDWFQDSESITLTLYEPSIVSDSVGVSLDGANLRVLYNTSDDDKQKEFTLKLFSHAKNPIENPGNFKLFLTQKKLELKLFKTEPVMWERLESEDSESVTLSNMKNTYSRFSDKYLNSELEEEEQLGSEDGFMKLLQDIYSKGDEKTKRAMVKSFTTSSGKVLSTNWDSVKDQ